MSHNFVHLSMCLIFISVYVLTQSPSLSQRSSRKCLRNCSWRRASGSKLKSSPTRCERVAWIYYVCAFAAKSPNILSYIHTYRYWRWQVVPQQGCRSVSSDLQAPVVNRHLDEGREGRSESSWCCRTGEEVSFLCFHTLVKSGLCLWGKEFTHKTKAETHLYTCRKNTDSLQIHIPKHTHTHTHTRQFLLPQLLL